MRNTTKHRKDDLVPKGFLYAISIMVMLSLLVVFSASLFPENKFDEAEKIEIFEKEKLILAKLSDGSVSIENLKNEELLNSNDGKSGFLSVIMTGLEYNRKKVGLELLDSYQIEIKRFASGRISLEDSKASWSLNVTSFGSKNSELFLSIF
jgi:putative photosynthetic complex assembly protein